MNVIEYRIIMPLSVAEFERAYRYALAKTAQEETVGEQGAETLAQRTYVNDSGMTVRYSHTLIRFGNRLPSWVNKCAPATALMVEEKTWDSYPTLRTVITNPFFNKLEVVTLTRNVDNETNIDNVHNLDPEMLAQRKVVYIDIAKDQVAPRDYKAHRDPRLVKSMKTGRGPLEEGWQTKVSPLMCSYKLVIAKADYWGIKKKAEALLQKGHYDLFTLNHKGAFALMDEWWDLTLDDVQQMEDKLLSSSRAPNVEISSEGQAQSLSAAAGASNAAAAFQGASSTSNPPHPVQRNSSDDISAVRQSRSSSLDDGISDADLFTDAMEEWVDSDAACATDGSGRMCGLCAVSGEGGGGVMVASRIFCVTCNEVYCVRHWQSWHATSRLRQHTTQEMASSLQHALEMKTEADRRRPTGAGSVMLSFPASHSIMQLSSSSNSSSDDFGNSGYGTGFSVASGPPRAIVATNIVALSAALINAAVSLVTASATAVTHRAAHHTSHSTSPCGWVGRDSSACTRTRISEYSQIDWKGAKAGVHMGNLNQLIGELGVASLNGSTHEDRLVFWLNTYNALVIHARCIKNGGGTGILSAHKIFQCSYIIAGHSFSLIEVEHSVLRAHGNTPNVLGSTLLLSQRLKSGDPRKAVTLSRWEPLVTFAISSGAQSSPPIRIYEPNSIRAALWENTHLYLECHVTVISSKRISVPKMLGWWAQDFGGNWREVIEFVFACVSGSTREALASVIGDQKMSKAISVASYDWHSCVRFVCPEDGAPE